MKTPTTLHDCVKSHIEAYFDHLNDTEPSDMNHMLLQAVERPLLEVVMRRADYNQSRAAQWLGLNRNTLRKKLLEHGLAD